MRQLLVFLFVISSYGTIAQVPFVQNFNLPSNEPIEIRTLFQDSNGFIWVGTNHGLYRFDGFSFSHYTTKDSLPDNTVSAIAQDSLGRIWMGHSNGHLSYFENNIIKKFNPSEGSATKEVSDILFDSDGVMWFSTLNDGLYYYLNERLFRLDEDDGIPDLYIYDLEKCNAGQIWAGTDGGIAICTLDKVKATIQVLDSKQGLPDNIVRKIKYANPETIWLGTEDTGVIQYSATSKKFTTLLPQWTFGTVSDITTKQNQIWISCSQKEIVVVNTLNPEKILHLQTKGISSTLLLDQENGVWIANKTELIRTPGTEISFLEKFNTSISLNITAITLDHNQSIWFSNNEGLFKLKKIKNEYREIEKVNNPQLNNNFPVISLHTDSLGNVWAGSFGKGAIMMNTEGKVVHYFDEELRNGNILSICSRGNVIWFATLEGTIQITIQKNQYFVKNIGAKEGLSSDYIYQVFVDSRKRTWFATDGYGVDMLDATGIHHFTLGETNKVVYGLAEDGNHVIWANVQGEGLYKLLQNTFVPFKTPHPNSIQSLTTNTFGNIVAVHDFGLDVIDIRENTIHSIGEESGIKYKRGNLNSITSNQEGHIFIGTDNGIILYEAGNQPILKKPIPFIQKLKAGNLVFNNTNNAIIDYNDNDVTISYLGFWYESPQSLSYQYQLVNFDRDWISSKNHEVTYSRLPAGEYIFKLRVSDTDTFENATEHIIQFRVKPPFWQQAWFYIVIAALVIYSVYGFIKLRERNFIREGQLLKAKVTERTKELRQRNEEVLAQAEELQAQSTEIQRINNHLEELVYARTAELEKKNKALEEYAFINAHKLRSPLASILGLVNILIKMPQSPESKECTRHLEDSAKALDEIVSSITKTIEKADQ